MKKKTKLLEDDMNAPSPSKATIIKAFQYINDEIGSLDAKLNESLVNVDINLNKVIDCANPLIANRLIKYICLSWSSNVTNLITWKRSKKLWTVFICSLTRAVTVRNF